VIGVDANPEAYEHASARYRRLNLSFRRELVEEFDEPVDAVVFLQTIEHIHEPDRLLASIAEIAPVAYVSTPNRLTLAPPGAEKSNNPWHLREYDPAEYRELLEPHFERVEILGLNHARKLRVHELAIRLGWDRVHPALRLTEPFYERFIPSIRASDFQLRAGDLDRALDFLAVCEGAT
jgi:SAM-dependent methyltransferase